MDRDIPRLEDVAPFLRAIADRTGDPLPRLIFSDWLEEHGFDRLAFWQRRAANAPSCPYWLVTWWDEWHWLKTVSGWDHRTKQG
jgi:uncharacterized protein (TIGR02996 family)